MQLFLQLRIGKRRSLLLSLLLIVSMLVPNGAWAQDECDHTQTTNFGNVYFCTKCGTILNGKGPVPSNQIWYQSTDNCPLGTSSEYVNDYCIEKNEYDPDLGCFVMSFYDDITTIGFFSWAKTLRSIILPNSVTAINAGFSYCYNLERIYIPASVTEIGNDTFHRCAMMESDVFNFSGKELSGLVIADAIYNGVYVKDNCVVKSRTDVMDVSLPESITDIDDEAFLGCWKEDCQELNLALHSIPRFGNDVFSPKVLLRLTLSLNDNSYVTTEANLPTVYDANYSRTMTSEWETLVLPFAFKISEQSAGFDFYSVKSILEGNFLTMEPCEEVVAAGTPVLIHRTGKNTSITIRGIKGKGQEISTSVSDGFSEGLARKGVYQARKLTRSDANCYFIQDNKLHSTSQLAEGDTVTILPFRAYFTTESSCENEPLVAQGIQQVLFDAAITAGEVQLNSTKNVSQLTFSYNNGTPQVLLQCGASTLDSVLMLHVPNVFALTPVHSINLGSLVAADASRVMPRLAPAAATPVSTSILSLTGNGIDLTYPLSNVNPIVRLQLMDGKYYIDGTEVCSAAGVSVICTVPHDYENFACKYCSAEQESAEAGTMADATAYKRTSDITVSEFTYTRSFQSTNWISWYVPFELELTEELLEHYAFSRINNVHQYDDDNDGRVDRTVLESFRQAAGTTLQANYPYLVKALTDADKSMSLTLQNVCLKKAEVKSVICRSVDTQYTFTGTYTGMGDSGTRSDSPYTLFYDGNWWHFRSLAPQRHYLTITSRDEGTPSLAPSFRIVIKDMDEVTGLENVNDNLNPDLNVNRNLNANFDLQGQRISRRQKGISIVNGKVVFTK